MADLDRVSRAEQLITNAGNSFGILDFETAYEDSSEAAGLLRKDSSNSESATRCLADALAIMIVSLKAMLKPKEAKNLGKECLLHMRQTGHLQAEGVILCALAEVYIKNMGSQGRVKAAKQATEAVGIFRQSSDQRMLAKSLVLQAKVSAANIDKNYSRTEWRYHEALSAVEICQEALDISKGIGDRAGEASALSLIAHCRVFGGLEDDWLEPAQASHDIHRELRNVVLEAYDLYMIAYWYSIKEEWSDVLRYAKEAMAMFKDANHARGYVAMCLQLIYQAHMRSSDVDSAVSSVKEGLSWFSVNEDKEGQASCHELMVDLYLAEEDHAEAIASAERGLELVRILGDKRWESNMLHELAVAHAATENPQAKDKAINAMKQSLVVFQKVKDLKGEAQLLESLCHLYLAKDKIKEALLAAQKMRTCCKRAKDDTQEGEALMMLYRVHVSRQKPAQAVKVAQEAFNIFENMEERARLAKALVMSASAYMMDQKHNAALEVCTRALKISRGLGDKTGEDYALSVIQQIDSAHRGDRPAYRKQDEQVVPPTDASSVGVVLEVEAPQLSTLDPQLIFSKVTQVAKNIVACATDELKVDQPLMDSGMDSLSAVAFRNSLMAAFSGLNLPASVMFDFPNIRLLSDEIFDRSKTVAMRVK